MDLRESCWMSFPFFNVPQSADTLDSCGDESLPASVDLSHQQSLLLMKLSDSSLVSIYSLPIAPYFCCGPQSTAGIDPHPTPAAVASGVKEFSADSPCLSGLPAVLVKPDVFCVLLQFANGSGGSKPPLIISWGALKATVVRMILRGQFFYRYGIHFGNFDDLV